MPELHIFPDEVILCTTRWISFLNSLLHDPHTFTILLAANISAARTTPRKQHAAAHDGITAHHMHHITASKPKARTRP